MKPRAGMSDIKSLAILSFVPTMEYLRSVQEFLEEEAENYCKKCVESQENGFLLIEDEYKKVPEAIKPLILKKILSLTAGKEKDLEKIHLRDMESLFEKQTGRKLDFPYQIEARRVYEGIQISRKDMKKKEKSYEITCRVRKIEEIEKNQLENSSTKWFDYDIIRHEVCFRKRRPGDYITINESGQTQKLKSYFINEKIPKEERDNLLLVADGSHILWIFGYRLNCAYQVTEHTKQVLEIRINEGE